MKNFSIKKRVTLYYSFVLITIAVLFFGVFVAATDIQTTNITEKTMATAVQNAFDEITCDNDIIEIDNDFDAYSRGVTLLIYSANGTLILGTPPADFPASTPLTSGSYEPVTSENDNWLVYDLYNNYPNGESLWVRGIYATDNGNATMKSIMTTMLIVFPLLIFLAIFAGRRITNQAFIPVAKMTNAAEHINSGNDLSLRIPLQSNKDELYALAETLNAMIDRLENAFESEKQFASDVSHELKTPISVILAECEYTLQETRTSGEYVESMESIEKQCKRTMALISQLLQLSRTINKENMIVKEEINLSIMCESLIEELSLTANNKNLVFLKEIQENVTIFADETLIMRMILNLMTNGLKYGKPGGFIKLFMGTCENNMVKISVSDDGIGISKEDSEHIFNRFYKADRARMPGENSFGLGLSMVKWIAEAHGGTISLDSVLGEGSRFTVMLPI
ncbi:MAG: HAMP domain-containing sensor histidine kinase [Anaerovoracaceae bacterium]